MIICADSLDYIAGCEDGSFAGVVTDPPETISGDVIPELLRVSAGPVLVLAPLVLMGEAFPRAMRLPVLPEAVMRWWAEGPDGWLAWGPIYCWRVAGPWTERRYDLKAFSIDGFPGAKPVDLFRGLCRLIGKGPILDPFAGSGPTYAACRDLGFESVSIDNDQSCCDYIGGEVKCTSKT